MVFFQLLIKADIVIVPVPVIVMLLPARLVFVVRLHPSEQVIAQSPEPE
jgi:hypothetical protein